MALQIRRGTDAQRQTIAFKSGELIYTTDLKDMWVGDGVTNGGTQLSPVKSVNGSTGTVVLTTDQITQGSTNKYYSTTQAKIDSGAALVAGNAGNTGITFSYNSGTNVINAVVTNVGGLSTVSGDTSPALGGNLSLNSRNIIGTGQINITGNITASNASISNSTLTLTTNSITTTNQVISLGTPTIQSVVNIYPSASNAVNVFGPPGVAMEFFAANGTLASPTTLTANDGAGGLKFSGKNSTGINQTVASIFAIYKGPASDLADATMKSQGILYFIVGDGTASATPVNASLDQYGLFTAPVLSTTVYSAAGTAIPSAVSRGVGARAFVSDATVATFATAYTSGGSNKVPVYSDGTVWRIG
jgi:hypothetical protein